MTVIPNRITLSLRHIQTDFENEKYVQANAWLMPVQNCTVNIYDVTNSEFKPNVHTL